MATRPLLALAFTLAFAPCACGEDVDFASGRVDGAAPDAVANPDGVPAMGDAPSDAPATPGDAPATFGDGALDAPANSSCPGDAGPGGCRENGSMCRATRDCCSNRCEDGYCLPSSACSAPGVACNTRSNCCSLRCEPTGRMGGLACAQYCQADGTRCDDPSECCSLGCNGGLCGGSLCVTAGGACTDDSQCCSARCIGSRCVPVPAACLPTGEGCSEESGMTCCSTFCNARTQRCDLGPGGCRESSSPCNVDGDCCRGQCLRDAQGVDVCTAPCLADGQDCNSNGDCCEGICTGAPSQCRALPPNCP